MSYNHIISDLTDLLKETFGRKRSIIISGKNHQRLFDLGAHNVIYRGMLSSMPLF